MLLVAAAALVAPQYVAADDATHAEKARRASELAREALEAALRAQALAVAAQHAAEDLKNDSLRSLRGEGAERQHVEPTSVSHVVEQLRENADSLLLLERVLVGADTVNLIIPERNFGRFDRGLHNFLFIPKGKWAFGLTASYGEFDTEDVQVLSFLKDFNFKGSMFSLSPSVSYFVRHNLSVGMNIGYSRNKFTLGSLSVDIDDDLNFSLRDVDYHSESYSAAVFLRKYIGLDNNRRFAIYNDVELKFASGNGTFSRLYNNEPKETRTLTTKASLNFSPGLCVFIQEYVSFNISFGVFGVNYTRETQRTDGVNEGSRQGIGASFKFNLLNLNMGVAVHI